MMNPPEHVVEFAPEALARFEETIRFLKQQGARKLRETLLLRMGEALRTLPAFPNIGVALPGYQYPRRYLLAGSYSLVYELEPSTARIRMISFSAGAAVRSRQ